MISSAKYSQESPVSNEVSYDGVWNKNENPDIFGGIFFFRLKSPQQYFRKSQEVWITR